MTLGARDWVLIAMAVVVAGVCVRLGLWQLERLGERKARNAAIAERLVQPPVDLTYTVTVEGIAGRRVSARGVYDYARERVWPARAMDGVPGVGVLTPLRFRDGRAVFVDRGWAPSPDGLHVDLPRLRERETADIVGIAHAPPRGRGDVDPVRLADSLPYDVLPVVVQQTGNPFPGGPRRWPEPRLTNGPHLGYAVQWFSFAAIAVVGTGILLRKGRTKTDEGGRG